MSLGVHPTIKSSMSSTGPRVEATSEIQNVEDAVVAVRNIVQRFGLAAQFQDNPLGLVLFPHEKAAQELASLMLPNPVARLVGLNHHQGVQWKDSSLR